MYRLIVYYYLLVVYSLVRFLSISNNYCMKDNRNKLLALNIKAERIRKGLTQFDLAEKINISESSISLIERGIQTPSVFVVYDIAKLLNIDINELFKNI